MRNAKMLYRGFGNDDEKMTLRREQGIENFAAEEQLQGFRKQLRKKVKQAKHINNLNGETIFRAMKWPNSTRKYTTPPIQKLDGSLDTSNKDKQATLKQVLLTPTIHGGASSNQQIS